MATKAAVTKSESTEYAEGLSVCETPQQIESFFQAGIKGKPFESHYELRRACNERAIEIAPRFKYGHLLAIRKDKRTGRSRRYEVNGQSFHTGTWGNGAGFRWAMVSFEQWYEGLLREGGLRSQRKIETIISWAREDFLWRSLKELA